MLARLGVAALVCLCPAAGRPQQPAPVRNIVLVHGAWVDGSGWKPVNEKLKHDGYQVTIVQEPLTSFSDGLKAVARTLEQQPSPCILVAHSYGGSLISEAGTDPHVAALVYVAAHMPDAGENEAADGERYPGALSEANLIEKTADGYTRLKPVAFPAFFAADLPAAQAEFEANSQVPTNASVFSGTITTPARQTKPSWMVVAGADKVIDPALERWYATRAHSHVVEVAGASHSVYESRPAEVVAAIKAAAQQAHP